MYRIIKNGAELALIEAPSYVRQARNGCFVLCQEAEAAGIAHNGTVYHLLGREALEGAESVILEKTDAGDLVKRIQDTAKDVDAMNVDQELRLTLRGAGKQDGHFLRCQQTDRGGVHRTAGYAAR